MKAVNFRSLFGGIILLSTGLILIPNPSVAQRSMAYDSLSSNSGAYGEFDLGSTMNQSSATARGGGMESNASRGSSGNTTYQTNDAPAQKTQGNSRNTSNQSVGGLPRAGWMALDRVFGGGKPLPPTVLDSFVKTAAGNADQIYGDEGTDGLPPFFGFEENHRIERGIYNPLLTTGHRSPLPEAWGWPN